MDYKITKLNDQLECKEQLLADFPTLLFGSISNDVVVFDSTAFCYENNIEEVDYHIFQRVNRKYIDAFVKYAEISQSQLFYINKNGHTLMNKELAFLFMSFAMPELSVYFNGLLGDLIANGVAYSDGFVMAMCVNRIPIDILKQVVNERTTTNNKS